MIDIGRRVHILAALPAVFARRKLDGTDQKAYVVLSDHGWTLLAASKALANVRAGLSVVN
jgi:hypothetical protein